MYNSVSGRMDFEVGVRIFAETFNISDAEVKSRFRPTLSRLRLEQPCSATTTGVTFPVLANQQSGTGTQTNTEVRLSLQDIFMPFHLAYRIGIPTGSTDGAYKMLSYINPFFLNPAMQVFYNGTLQLMINNDQYLNSWPLDWHDKRNQTQQTSAAGPGSPVDMYDGDVDGKVSMQPSVLLSGSSKINLSMQFPAAPTAITANSRHILLFDGLIFQNATVVS